MKRFLFRIVVVAFISLVYSSAFAELPYILQIHDAPLSIAGSNINALQDLQDASSKKDSTDKKVTSENQIRSIAKEYGLLNETKTNPHLAFLPVDITYWSGAEVSESRLRLEFAARKIVLEEADKQGVTIKDQGSLAWAAQKIMADLLQVKN